MNADLVSAAVVRFNSEFGLRYFGRPLGESVPTERRRLTEFRGRLGLLIEYGLGTTMDSILHEDYGASLRLSFVVNQQFPDFYLRGGGGAILLRLDCKALHDESAEYSARFELSRSRIDPARDFLLYIAWKWKRGTLGGTELTYPHVEEGLVVPAIEIADERDLHLAARGGSFLDDGTPVVPPLMNVDTNFGKINRIVHGSRQYADLSPHIKRFVDFSKRHADSVARAESAPEPTVTPDEANPI